MKYTYDEVLDIIKSTTDTDPKEVLSQWIIKKANTPLDLTDYEYPLYVYTFPITIEGKDVGDITLVDLYHNIGGRDDLMLKYFGKEDYDISWDCFSHDTYLFCYLTIRKEFELPEIVKGFCGDTFQCIDANGRPFEFKLSYGDPENEKDSYVYDQWVDDRSYRFDNGVTIQVNKMNGWLLGQKINQNVEKRLIPYKRDNKIESILK